MIREEAIEVIEQDISCEHDTDLIEALKMAIKALEQEPVIRDNGVKDELNLVKDELEPTTMNDLAVDCISRADAIRVASGYCHPSNVVKELAKLPSVTPQEPQSFEWCTDCKEYDQEKHCCHRWSKVIRDTVEDMKQEPKSEWQQDHEILKAYSDGASEVLDKIRAEIEAIIGEHNLDDYDFCSGLIVARKIIDKYKAESAHDVAQDIVNNNGVVDL